MLLADNTYDPRDAVQRPGARHRRYPLPCTPEGTPVGPLIRQLLAAVEADVKDRSYRQSKVGETVGRFIDSVEYSSAANTVISFESPLAKLARLHDDLESVHEFCERPELLEQFLYVIWRDSAEKTKAHRWDGPEPVLQVVPQTRPRPVQPDGRDPEAEEPEEP